MSALVAVLLFIVGLLLGTLVEGRRATMAVLGWATEVKVVAHWKTPENSPQNTPQNRQPARGEEA